MHVREDLADVNGFVKHLARALSRTQRLLPERRLSMRNVHVDGTKEERFCVVLSQVGRVVEANA